MYPIALDLAKLPVLLVGEGPAFAKRKAQLMEAGAAHLLCHSRESGNPDFFEDLDSRFRGNDVKVVLVVGLDADISGRIAEKARAAGKLVNVEDMNALCDFYYMSQVRRGELVIAVSTSGASPTLAKRVRDTIASLFDERWAGFTQEIKDYRLSLKSQGRSMQEIMVACENFLEKKGWFSECRTPQQVRGDA